MSSGGFTESVVEQAALAWLESLGYTDPVGAGDCAGESQAERDDYGQVVLERAAAAGAPAAQSAGAGRCLGGGVPQADPAGLAVAGGQQPCRPQVPGRGRAGRVSAARWVDRRRPRPRAGLRRPGEQRVPGGEPVHGGRGPARAPAGHRAVRQRPAAGGDRAEKRRRRERHDLVGVQPASDLQAADSVAVRVQRGAGDLRRRAGPDRHADGRPRMVHAVADHRGRGTGRYRAAAVAGGAGGRVRQAAVPGPDPALHRVRGRGRRGAGQEDGRLSPVPRGEPGAANRRSKAAGERETSGSAWSGTRRDRARA